MSDATADRGGVAAGPPPDAPHWPRISIVTPVRNSERFLDAAIRSVLDQGYPDLEYIVVDGGSSDGSVDIIRRYEDRLAHWVSEPDPGMYSALNKGFARATGDVMGWLTATDILHHGALRVVGSAFAQLPTVEWVTGIPTGLSEDGMTVSVGPLRRWSRGRFLLGANRYVQQESTFWRRSLWERAGGRVDTERERFSDFELWLRFFRHAPLHPVRALIGGFRHHADSRWLLDRAGARRVSEDLIAAELGRVSSPAFRLLGQATHALRRMPGGGWIWDRTLAKLLHAVPGPDRPPALWHDGTRWRVGG